MKNLVNLVVFTAVIFSTCYSKSYYGYQVLRTKDVPMEAIPKLLELKQNAYFDFWSDPQVGIPAIIISGPDNVNLLMTELEQLKLEPTVYVADLQRWIDTERQYIENIRKNENRDNKQAVYDRYMNFTEIDDFLHEIVEANPGIAQLLEIADTSELRHFHAINISNPTVPNKPSVVIDCGIHAREWLGPPVCLKLIEDVIASTELQGLVNWYIIPVANPDGYEYSWTDDRMWRKTRRVNAGSSCVGVDPNRNFNVQWNTNGSTDPCSETYPGPFAFSEPECQGMGLLLDSLKNNFAAYVTVHSYGQVIVYPYGYTADPAPNAAALLNVGQKASDVIKSFYDTTYIVGQSSTTIYFTEGSSQDYAYAVSGTQFSYTIELPGNDFQAPESAILNVVTETVPGIVSIIRDAVAQMK